MIIDVVTINTLVLLMHNGYILKLKIKTVYIHTIALVQTDELSFQNTSRRVIQLITLWKLTYVIVTEVYKSS